SFSRPTPGDSGRLSQLLTFPKQPTESRISRALHRELLTANLIFLEFGSVLALSADAPAPLLLRIRSFHPLQSYRAALLQPISPLSGPALKMVSPSRRGRPSYADNARQTTRWTILTRIACRWA